jgi:uncharacterized protein (DUF1810 family)
MPSPDPFHLQRFLDAQSTTYPQARAELAAGQKRSHWMWFIFPQIQGLGSSPMAQRYAITELAEARAYLAHPTLGARLRECTALVHAIQNRTLEDVLGYPDNLKFHSSITLFAEASETATPGDSVFHAALTRWFGGQPDEATLKLLKR